MSFNLLPLDNQQLINNLPSFNNTLLLIETIKNIPNPSFTCLDRRDNQQAKQQDNDSLIRQLESEKQGTPFETPLVKQKKTGCTCRKTSCLKRYCQCFSSGKICTSECACCGCKNSDEHVELIKQAKGLINNKSARKNTQGCICKKSHCQKKYCQCFNAGIGCTQACKCVGCQNNTCRDSHEELAQNIGGNKNKKLQEKCSSASKLESSPSFGQLQNICKLDD